MSLPFRKKAHGGKWFVTPGRVGKRKGPAMKLWGGAGGAPLPANQFWCLVNVKCSSRPGGREGKKKGKRRSLATQDHELEEDRTTLQICKKENTELHNRSMWAVLKPCI